MMQRQRWGVFIDRDGTLLRLVPYLADPGRARLYQGAGPALARLRAAGARLVVVTNQSGIARGLFTRPDVDGVHREMERQLARHGVRLDAIEVCPHLPSVTGPCSCRKPAPGMLTRAARRLGINLDQSWMIGDNQSDLGVARAAGTKAALVLTGYGRATRRTRAGRSADVTGSTLASVVNRILAARERPGA
ncbi:MAG: HAD-IIIA family hydrolase [Candidatus Eisenbacteria bacterium]|nr:HAD-IIIA family hydrolase [Candidatus Eisenbacteria bacterium]